ISNCWGDIFFSVKQEHPLSIAVLSRSQPQKGSDVDELWQRCQKPEMMDSDFPDY
uniref:Ketoacyl_synth_N domain-containing protein n=1 Tax=Haemonchus contortus TaxID=6289 RepID=A0A7I5E8K6_HAECO